MKYSAYPKYKDSGVEWLKTIPYDWESTKLKYVSDFQTGWTPPTANKESYEGDDCWATIGDLGSRVIYDTENRISKKAILDQNIPIVSKGSLLFSFKLSIGQVSFAGIDLFTNEAIAAFTQNNNIDLGFAYYLFPVSIVKNATNNIYGAKLLNQFLIKNSYLPLPPLSTQKAIATFLDNETVKIDGLIKDYEELITLLQEKRQALISHAVTRGLSELVSPDDPEFGEWAKPVKFKDSGVEWLGEIPEEWEVIQGRYLGNLFGSELVNEEELCESGSVAFIKVSSLSLEHDEITESEWYLDIPKHNCSGYQSNFVVFPKRGAAIFLNKVNIIGFPAILDPNLMGWSPFTITDVEFLAFLIKARGLSELADTSTVPQLNNKHILPEKFPLPDRNEQKAIVSYLKNQTSKIDSLITETESAISLLKEHRSALITNAVTGKINVEALV